MYLENTPKGINNCCNKTNNIKHKKINIVNFNFILQIFKATNEVKKEKRIGYRHIPIHRQTPKISRI
jgi:hypothetical protein